MESVLDHEKLLLTTAVDPSVAEGVVIEGGAEAGGINLQTLRNQVCNSLPFTAPPLP